MLQNLLMNSKPVDQVQQFLEIIDHSTLKWQQRGLNLPLIDM